MNSSAFRTIILALGIACVLRDSELSAQPVLTTVKLGIVPAVVSVQAYVAQDFGIFKKHGLDVQFFPTTAGVNTISALVGGSLDLAFGDAVAVSSARVHNIPLKFMAPGIVDTTRVPVLAILVKPNGSIHDVKDLNGKTIAVNSIRSMSTVMTSAWVDGNGGDAKTLKFVELPFPQVAAAIANGTVDAGLVPEPFLSSALEGGLRAMPFEKGAVHDYMVSGWIATPAWLAANPDTAARFIAAMKEATEFANKQPVPPDVADVLTKYTKIPAVAITHMKFPDLFGTAMDVHYVQRVVDATAKYGVIDQPFPAADIVYQPK
jgi:NitT/TauT family transport system substrate-binding protein